MLSLKNLARKGLSAAISTRIDIAAPNNARPSAGTVPIIQLEMYPSNILFIGNFSKRFMD